MRYTRSSGANSRQVGYFLPYDIGQKNIEKDNPRCIFKVNMTCKSNLLNIKIEEHVH